jgi:hypothetical protein
MDVIIEQIKEAYGQLQEKDDLGNFSHLLQEAAGTRQYFILVAAFAIKQVEKHDRAVQANAKRGRGLSL